MKRAREKQGEGNGTVRKLRSLHSSKITQALSRISAGCSWKMVTVNHRNVCRKRKVAKNWKKERMIVSRAAAIAVAVG